MQAIRPAQIDDWSREAAAGLSDGQLPVVLDVREPHELQTACVTADGFTFGFRIFDTCKLGKETVRCINTFYV